MLRAFAVSVLVCIGSPSIAAQEEGGLAPAYSYVVLPGHLPSQASFASDMNEDGEIIGYGLESLWHEGVHWPDTTSFVNLNTAHGYEASFGYGINDDGVWVGSASFDGSTTKETIVLKEPGQPPRFLPQLVEEPLIASYGYRITNNGLIVGACDTIPTVFGESGKRAVLWENEVPRNLGTLGGNLSQATSVNEAATVVGISNLVPGELIRAFVWTDELGMVQLPGFFPGARTVATDVNGSDLIVGDADGTGGRSAVTWTGFDTLVPLPKLSQDGNTYASAVNDHGQIVGQAVVGAGFDARLWQDGVAYDLEALVGVPELDVYGVIDINEDGRILAHAFDRSSNPPVHLALMLTPDLRWQDLGHALAGTNGAPQLAGLGNLLPGGPFRLSLSDARENATAYLVLGLVAVDAPFKGGVLVPSPVAPTGALFPLLTDGAGGIDLEAPWLDGLPSGFSVYFQYWIVDPAGVFGFAASNAVSGTTP